MTPEERSQEMHRRRMVALGKAKPRDRDKYRRKLKAAARKHGVQKAAQPAYKKAGGDRELQRIYQARFEAKRWNQMNPTEPAKPIPPLPGSTQAA